MRQSGIFRVRVIYNNLPLDEEVLPELVRKATEFKTIDLSWMPEVGDGVCIGGVEFDVVRRVALTTPVDPGSVIEAQMTHSIAELYVRLR